MMRTNAWMRLMTIATIGLASCSQIPESFSQSKQDANGRWNDVRSRLKCQLASESLDRGRLDEARRHVDEAIGLNPQGAEAYVLLTRILLERGETASAQEALSRAIELGDNTAETDYLNGLISQRYNQLADALISYRSASTRDPMNAHYVAAVAETLVAMNRVADALALVRDRWTDFEHNATLRSLAGEIHMMLGQYEDAADAYRQAAQIAPDDVLLRYQLGLALTFTRNYRQGRDVLAGAVGDPDAPASVLSALGRCELVLAEYDNAKTALLKAVDVNPENPHSWLLLSQAALGSGDLLTARQAANQALQIEPGNNDHTMMLAYVCWRQQDYFSAIRALEQVLRDLPDDAMALLLLGQCHERTENPKAAKDCYRRALEANPKNDWARRLLEDGLAGVEPRSG